MRQTCASSWQLRIWTLAVVSSFAAISPCAAQTRNLGPGDWLLPNLASRLSVKVRNHGSTAADALATISVVQARQVAADFPGRLAFVVLLSHQPSGPAATFVPFRWMISTAMVRLIRSSSRSSCRRVKKLNVDIYYSTTLDDTISWPKRVSAKHSYGYNRQVAALESELMGYRMYGGFFLDMQARLQDRFGLFNDLAAYVPPRLDLGTGRDVFHIGATLGIGGFFLRQGDHVYQPPMNVPDYTHKPSPAMVPHFRVVANGPLRAIVEATLDEWTISSDSFRLKALYSIDQGEPFVRCRLEVLPLRLDSHARYDLGVGIRDLPDQKLSHGPGRLIVTGRQNARDGDIGIAAFFNPEHFSSPMVITTVDGSNQAVTSRKPITAGSSVQIEYAAAGAWNGSGLTDLQGSLTAYAGRVNSQLEVRDLKYSLTPHPEKVDSEAQ